MIKNTIHKSVLIEKKFNFNKHIEKYIDLKTILYSRFTTAMFRPENEKIFWRKVFEGGNSMSLLREIKKLS